jgi:hypothetical protein
MRREKSETNRALICTTPNHRFRRIKKVKAPSVLGEEPIVGKSAGISIVNVTLLH